MSLHVTDVRSLFDVFLGVFPLPPKKGQILDAMDSISKDARDLFAELKGAQDAGAAEALSAATAKIEGLIELNQHLLNAIGVGHPALDKVCATTKAFGLSAKLTGSGGGGCAFVLVPPDFAEEKMASVSSELEKHGFDVFETTVGGEGLSVSAN